MTLSTKIDVFLRILHLFAVGLHTCTAVARSLCVSWAVLFRFVITRRSHIRTECTETERQQTILAYTITSDRCTHCLRSNSGSPQISCCLWRTLV